MPEDDRLDPRFRVILQHLHDAGIRMVVDGRAAVDDDGFGGHTPLFGCVVSQP